MIDLIESWCQRILVLSLCQGRVWPEYIFIGTILRLYDVQMLMRILILHRLPDAILLASWRILARNARIVQNLIRVLFMLEYPCDLLLFYPFRALLFWLLLIYGDTLGCLASSADHADWPAPVPAPWVCHLVSWCIHTVHHGYLLLLLIQMMQMIVNLSWVFLLHSPWWLVLILHIFLKFKFKRI